VVIAPVEKCSACGEKLWGVVRHCPFCGAPVAADAVGAAAAVAEEPVAASALAVDSVEPQPQPEVAVPSAKPVKPKAPQVQATGPTTAASHKAHGPASPPSAPVAAPRKRSRKLWIGVALAAVLVYGFWNSAPPEPDACDQSLAQAQSAMQQDNAQQARQHARTAMTECKDKERARLAKTANDSAQALLKTQAQAQARAEQQSRQLAQQQRQQQGACENANRQTAGHMRSGRLESAEQNLQRVDQACRQLGETQALIAQYEGMRSTAVKATADARAQLARGALAQARTSLEVLASVNRESDELPVLRAALNRAQAAPVEVIPRPAPEPSAQGELLRGFLRDAEAAMQQRLYDKAKTYAESAQRIDPRNAEVARLLRRIREHEMSYLRERIVIE
jgi:tetratricopeptide (TPR) repeat protein